MERFVCNRKWRSNLSWAVAIAMLIAIEVFGAPLMTIAYVIAAELIFFTAVDSRYRRR